MLTIMVACGNRREPQPIELGSGVHNDATLHDATISTWPTAPVPTIPPGLTATWPTTNEVLLDSWPALAEPTGVRLGDLTVKLQPAVPPVLARVWIAKPLTASGDLVTLWGAYVKDAHNQAVWFDSAHGIKARYPALDAAGQKGIEIAPYTPILERIEAAPDGLLAGAGPLLGHPDTALDNYRPWVIEHDARIAQLWLPPGEFDTAHLPCAIGIHEGRIWRVRLTATTGPAPHDLVGFRSRLDARWGKALFAKGDTMKWKVGDVSVTLTTYRHTIQIDYEVKP